MDAEIGIRNLADETRYNVLPDVIRALYSTELRRPLHQLPEYERLSLLVSCTKHHYTQAKFSISLALKQSLILPCIIHSLRMGYGYQIH